MQHFNVKRWYLCNIYLETVSLQIYICKKTAFLHKGEGNILYMGTVFLQIFICKNAAFLCKKTAFYGPVFLRYKYVYIYIYIYIDIAAASAVSAFWASSVRC